MSLGWFALTKPVQAAPATTTPTPVCCQFDTTNNASEPTFCNQFNSYEEAQATDTGCGQTVLDRQGDGFATLLTVYCGSCDNVPECGNPAATTFPPRAPNCTGSLPQPTPIEPVRGGPIIGFGNPLCVGLEECSIPFIIGRAIRTVLGIVGSIALAIFVYGGFVWMTARGNDEKVKHAKDVLTWATMGLIVIFASYIAVSFIIDALA